MMMRENAILPPEWGEWSIVKELGEGSFGKVYQIRKSDDNITTTSALKVLHIPVDETFERQILKSLKSEEHKSAYIKELVDRCADEIRVMYQLQGETNIVSIQDHLIKKDVEEEKYTIYIRMEYLMPLSEYLQEHSFEEEDVIQMGIDICRALERCERYKIIHRDIKPDNMFVSSSRSFKLGDFGIARKIKELYASYSTKGTVVYMAPEVYKGLKYGANADIYSLGLILYQYMNDDLEPFLSSEKQFIRMQDREEAFARRMSGEQIPMPAKASTALGHIILKACAYRPEQRYQSAQELRNALEQCIQAKKIEHAGQDVSVGYRRTTDTNRRTATETNRRTTTDTNQREMTTTSVGKSSLKNKHKKSKKRFGIIGAAVGIMVLMAAAGFGMYNRTTKNTLQTINIENEVTDEMKEAAAACKEMLYHFGNQDIDISECFLMPEYANVQSISTRFGVTDSYEVETIPLARNQEDGCLINIVCYLKDKKENWTTNPVQYFDFLQMCQTENGWKINNYADIQQSQSYVDLLGRMEQYAPEGFLAAKKAQRSYSLFSSYNYMYLGSEHVYNGRKTCDPQFMWEAEDGTVYVAMIYANGQSETVRQKQISAKFVDNTGKYCFRLQSDQQLKLKAGESKIVIYPLEKIADSDSWIFMMQDFTCE
ncbi:MAG: serine/threonine-protein kinase [Eubacteriales bacterium]|nr:serine/threonine-protein kinase [Eubacteriales bacterium]